MQNQSNCKISFDTQLKTTLSNSALMSKWISYDITHLFYKMSAFSGSCHPEFIHTLAQQHSPTFILKSLKECKFMSSSFFFIAIAKSAIVTIWLSVASFSWKIVKKSQVSKFDDVYFNYFWDIYLCLFIYTCVLDKCRFYFEGFYCFFLQKGIFDLRSLLFRSAHYFTMYNVQCLSNTQMVDLQSKFRKLSLHVNQLSLNDHKINFPSPPSTNWSTVSNVTKGKEWQNPFTLTITQWKLSSLTT